MSISFLQDLKFGLRLIRRSPYVTGLAIFCLASGIGLSTFMFSITWAIVGRGLPFEEQGKIIHIMRQENVDVGNPKTLIMAQDFYEIQAQQTSFEHLGAMVNDGVTVGIPGQPHRLDGAYVSHEIFEVLPVHPLLGRTFSKEDCQPESNRVLILSYKSWRDHFASDPDVVGLQVVCEGEPFTVIGVLPEGYDYPFKQQVWMPMIPELLKDQTAWIEFVTLLGRLKDDRTLDQARAEFSLIMRRIEDTKSLPEPILEPPSLEPLFNRYVNKEFRILMWSMFGATFLVLLIACSNVSSILTARMVVRSNEMAIRSAMGANRLRIMIQILGEALLYGIFGTLAGLAVAWKALNFLWLYISQHRFGPPDFMQIRLDPIAILVASGLMLVAVLVSGFLPAWRASKPNILSLLNDSQRTGSSKRLSRLSTVSTTMQIAFSFALLVAAGRLVYAIVMMSAMDYPFEEKGLLVGSVAIDGKSYPEEADTIRFWDQLYRDLNTIQGTDGVALGFNMPGVFGMTEPISLPGEDYASKEAFPQVRVNIVSPGYFKTLGVDILSGRDFNEGDIKGKECVAIINTVMAEKFWPRENPIGKVFYRERGEGALEEKERAHRVVGVVPDLKMDGLVNVDDDGAGFYRTQLQALWGDQRIFVRTSGNPGSFISEVQNAINLIDSDIAFTEAMEYEEHVSDAFFFFRFFMNLFSTFGGMALLLAAAGTFGIIQYSVSQRLVEIGIRMCLGASPASIQRMIFFKGLRNTLIGIAIGFVIALGLVKILTSAFQGIPNEYYSYLCAFVVLVGVAVVANGVPANRAARQDPMHALRVH